MCLSHDHKVQVVDFRSIVGGVDSLSLSLYFSLIIYTFFTIFSYSPCSFLYAHGYENKKNATAMNTHTHTYFYQVKMGENTR